MRWVGDRIGKEERTDISIKRLPCRRRQQPNLPVTGYLGMLLILHERKKKKRGKETVVHPFTPVSHDNSTRHFRNGQHFEQDRDRFSFILFYSRKIRGIVKIQGEYRFPPARFRKTASLRAFNREAFDVFLKRCQKRNRLNISILRPRGGEGDARQSSCQFFQRTNICLDVFDKGWLIHPD